LDERLTTGHMGKLFAFVLLFILLTGCAATTLIVVEKKETAKPFSKILAIYVDGDIDFSVFDSTTYNICIKSVFTDSAGYDTRSSTEDLIVNYLSTARSLIVKSSDFFDLYTNSYDDFTRQVDSAGIEALLIVHVRRYSYTKHILPTVQKNISSSSSVGVGGSYRTPNAAFECYLIEPHAYFPIWKAALDVKGKGYYNGKGALKTSMLEQLQKGLVSGGYIVPHRQP
jgi:hypothetical protein